MRLQGTDPDVQTIVSRLLAGDIDLRPNFQRGEVWPRAKKQKLIDSILRDWHVPPIHVIEIKGSRKQEVLDGQQRLAAIRDFAKNEFPVNGSAEPFDPEIAALGGLYYRELPPEWQRRFNHFTLRVFRITDYKPTEPGELFFRLNQPTSLTGAEQRNAFFGPVREQVKLLVTLLKELGGENFIGFKNSRMAYDDVVSRAGLALERRSIAVKITAPDLANFYRREQPLSDETMNVLRSSIEQIAKTFNSPFAQRYNKATLFSWIVFLARPHFTSNFVIGDAGVRQFLEFFATTKARDKAFHPQIEDKHPLNQEFVNSWLLHVYADRSSARVADVSSVILRDITLWSLFTEGVLSPKSAVVDKLFSGKLRAALNVTSRATSLIDGDRCAKGLIEIGWGDLTG